MTRKRLLFVTNESYFFVSHRLPVGLAAKAAGFDVHIAAPADHVWAPADFSVDALGEYGFTFHPIPLSRRSRNPAREAATLVALVRLYRSLSPDLVHHMTVKPILYGSLAARMTRVPAVVNLVTGLGQLFVARGGLSPVLRSLAITGYKIARGHPNAWTMVQNHGDLEVLTQAKAINPARATVVPGSGVDLGAFPPSPDPGGTPVVVMPARLIWEKGVQAFADAARSLKAEGVEARFALVGGTQPSNPRSVPEQTLRQWEAEGILEWWGHRSDMPEVLSESHIVCLPSTYGEGVPKILLEAAASGRPTVAADIPGCREAVRHGETGLLTTPGDGTALTQALAALIKDAALRRTYGAQARVLAEAEFSDTLVADRTMAVYKKLLQNV